MIASGVLRGTNENTNGLLRQYFPKGTDLSIHGPEELRRVQERLNRRAGAVFPVYVVVRRTRPRLPGGTDS